MMYRCAAHLPVVCWMCFLTHFTSATPCANACQDPHLQLAHGGRADFRGRHATLYNFVSSHNVTMNVKLEEAVFKLGRVTVYGTFITEVHFVLRTNAGRFFNVSYWACNLNDGGWSWFTINGTCSKPHNANVFVLGIHAAKTCDNLKVAIKQESAVVETHEWSFLVRSRPVYDRLSGPKHRIDVTVQQQVGDREFAVRPHGIVGQSFDGDNRPRRGRVDVYPSRDVRANFTTRAMAEGAIDGLASEYEMTWNYDTCFKYSRFSVAASNASKTVEPASLRTSHVQELDDDESLIERMRRLSSCNCATGQTMILPPPPPSPPPPSPPPPSPPPPSPPPPSPPPPSPPPSPPSSPEPPSQPPIPALPGQMESDSVEDVIVIAGSCAERV